MDKAKKKQIKKITTWVLLAALVATLAAMPLLAKQEAEADGPVATVHSGTVEAGTVSTSLHGGGTLVTEDIEEIQLPTGVKITEFLVKNGDTVTAGTPLAAVDKVSVMTAITSVTETMYYLQSEMKSAKNEKVSSTVSATAGGRIKKVFAQKGDSVQEVMLRDGALALLSLDGLMAVKIEKKLPILTGDTVTVTLADGTEVTGRIASNLDGVIVITVEDDGYEIGQMVTVTGKDGSEIGTGELYVHNAWAASAYSGIIQSAPAKEETKVNAGATLFTLTETDFRGKLEYLSALHREYEELMQELFGMYNTGIIEAPCDGTISGIDKDSPHLLADAGDGALEISLLTAESADWKVVLLGAEGSEVPPAGSLCNPNAEGGCPEEELGKHISSCPKYCHNNGNCQGTGKHYPTCIGSCTSGTSCSAKFHTTACIESCIPQNGICAKESGYHKDECIKSCKHATSLDECKDPKYPHYLDCVGSCVQSNGTRDCPSIKHLTGCIESCTHADTTDQCIAKPNHYLDCIHACIDSESAEEECPASKHKDTCFFAAMTYYAKVAVVTQVGSTDLVVRWDASGKEYEVVKTGTGWAFKNPTDFNPTLLVNEGKISVGNPSAFKPGDVILDITGYKGNKPEWSNLSVFVRLPGNIDLDLNLDGMMNGLMDSLTDRLTEQMMSQMDLSALMGMFSGFGDFSFYAPSPVEEEQLFDLEGSTLMTVSPQKTVSLTITLDEQDIAKVSVGQPATVKVEALSGETFQAEVTEVSIHGANSGGSSKFTAKLELPKASNMLDGMSATAALPLQEMQNIPTIPVVALVEDGAQTLVYTALDKEGNPTNPVPVTIGLSDGINAEILEGLDVGDTYYYSYYDVLEEDTGVEERFTLT